MSEQKEGFARSNLVHASQQLQGASLIGGGGGGYLAQGAGTGPEDDSKTEQAPSSLSRSPVRHSLFFLFPPHLVLIADELPVALCRSFN